MAGPASLARRGEVRFVPTDCGRRPHTEHLSCSCNGLTPPCPPPRVSVTTPREPGDQLEVRLVPQLRPRPRREDGTRANSACRRLRHRLATESSPRGPRRPGGELNQTGRCEDPPISLASTPRLHRPRGRPRRAREGNARSSSLLPGVLRIGSQLGVPYHNSDSFPPGPNTGREGRPRRHRPLGVPRLAVAVSVEAASVWLPRVMVRRPVGVCGSPTTMSLWAVVIVWVTDSDLSSKSTSRQRRPRTSPLSHAGRRGQRQRRLEPFASDQLENRRKPAASQLRRSARTAAGGLAGAAALRTTNPRRSARRALDAAPRACSGWSWAPRRSRSRDRTWRVACTSPQRAGGSRLGVASSRGTV